MKAACSAWRRHLAEPLVAFDTRNPPGQRLIDSRLLNVVLVLMLTTSMLGPVLSERFAPRLLNEQFADHYGELAGRPAATVGRCRSAVVVAKLSSLVSCRSIFSCEPFVTS